MKIRTITSGIRIDKDSTNDEILKAAQFNLASRQAFESSGYEVQTIRIATNPFIDYLEISNIDKSTSKLKELEKIICDEGNSAISLGFADHIEAIEAIPRLISETNICSFSAKIGETAKGIDYKAAFSSAKAIKRISESGENGYGNFRFCAQANCPPNIPFFPVAYHIDKRPKFTIGLECGDLLNKAFEESGGYENAEEKLREVFNKALAPIETIAIELSKKYEVEYGGIDASLAPSLSAEGSIAYGFEKIGLGQFGEPGTLFIASITTKILKSLNVKTCGYSGLMLPVAEDIGLATRGDEKKYNISNLLLYSSVCGCGLDTIPLAFEAPLEKIHGLILDTAALSIKLNKPLSVRLFPYRGKAAGERCEFNSPYLLNCNAFEI